MGRYRVSIYPSFSIKFGVGINNDMIELEILCFNIFICYKKDASGFFFGRF